MVYYELKKRVMRKRQKDEKTSILDIPDELLLNVMDKLPRSDALKMRLTCTAIIPAATSAIKARLKCLYIHPSPSNLRAIPEICEHPVFSQEIEEVVLLGGNPCEEMKKMLGTFDGLKKQFERFSTWPLIWPAKQSVIETACLQNVLCECLEKLPQLHRISFANRIRKSKPGYNELRASTIESFAKRYLHETSSHSVRCLDVFMLFFILEHPQLRFDTLVINSAPTVGTIAPGTVFGLKRLQITLHSAASGVRHVKDLWLLTAGKLIKSCQQLEHLRLDLSFDSFSSETRQDRYALELVLSLDAVLPHLRRLQMLSKRAATGHMVPLRPITQWSPRVFSFMKAHASSLESVNLENVLFELEVHHGDSHVPANTRQIIELLLGSDVKLAWKVDRFTHCDSCPNSRNSASSNDCELGCALFGIDPMTSLASFERLAADLGVELDEKTQTWDFGKSIIKGD